MKKLIKGSVLFSVDFHRYMFGGVYEVYFHLATEDGKFFINYLFFPKRLEELFNFKLELRPRFFVPVYQITRDVFVNLPPSDVVKPQINCLNLFLRNSKSFLFSAR